MATCAWWSFDFDTESSALACTAEAVYDGACDWSGPVCEQHRCRHSQPLGTKERDLEAMREVIAG